jgi:hypothetical protein
MALSEEVRQLADPPELGFADTAGEVGGTGDAEWDGAGVSGCAADGVTVTVTTLCGGSWELAVPHAASNATVLTSTAEAASSGLACRSNGFMASPFMGNPAPLLSRVADTATLAARDASPNP